MAEAYQHCYFRNEIHWNDTIWESLETLSSISKEAIDQYIGLPVLDPWPVAVHHQVIYKGALIAEVVKELPQLASLSIVEH